MDIKYNSRVTIGRLFINIKNVITLINSVDNFEFK